MEHPNIVTFEVFGDYALFSDPVMRVGGEKASYQIPTYEALKGILHSIYWKPTIVWYIDKVRVMNPIQTEVKGIRQIKYNGGNDLSFYTYLKDCRYQVQAHFEWNENRPELIGDRNENKHHNIAKRMIEKGGRRDIFLGARECQGSAQIRYLARRQRDIFLGARECQGYVEPCEFESGKGAYDETPELAFGLMYHGITYADEAYSDETKNRMTVRFWYPTMEKGVITFPRPEECTITKTVRENMAIKPFGEDLGNFIGLREFGEVE